MLSKKKFNQYLRFIRRTKRTIPVSRDQITQHFFTQSERLTDKLYTRTRNKAILNKNETIYKDLNSKQKYEFQKIANANIKAGNFAVTSV